MTKIIAWIPVLPALLLPLASIPLLPLPVLAPSLLVPFRPAPGTLCNHKAEAGKMSERERKSVPVPSHSVPFRPAPATVCNHKANKAWKLSERDKEDEQKPEHLAELILVPTVLAFDDCCMINGRC